MALVERLMHWGANPTEITDAEPESRWLSVHQFYGVMLELARGETTVANVKAFYSMTVEDEADFDTLVSKAPDSFEGKKALAEFTHGVFIVAEQRVAGYDTPALVRAKINGIAFPVRVSSFIPFSVRNNTWTNMPAALTEFLGANSFGRVKVNLADADRMRFVANVTTAGFAGSIIFVQYSTTFAFGTPITLTSNLALNPTGYKETAWEAIPTGAKGDVFLRVVGQGGDGAVDPVICSVMLEVR